MKFLFFLLSLTISFVILSPFFSTIAFSQTVNTNGLNQYGCPAFDPTVDLLRGFPQPPHFQTTTFNPEDCNPAGTLEFTRNGDCLCLPGFNGIKCDYQILALTPEFASTSFETLRSSLATYGDTLSVSFRSLPTNPQIFRWGYVLTDSSGKKYYKIIPKITLNPFSVLFGATPAGLDQSKLTPENSFYSMVYAKFESTFLGEVPSHTDLDLPTDDSSLCLTLLSTDADSYTGTIPANPLWDPIATLTITPFDETMLNRFGAYCNGRPDAFKNCNCSEPGTLPNSLGTIGNTCSFNIISTNIPFKHFIAPTKMQLIPAPAPQIPIFLIPSPDFVFHLSFQILTPQGLPASSPVSQLSIKQDYFSQVPVTYIKTGDTYVLSAIPTFPLPRMDQDAIWVISYQLEDYTSDFFSVKVHLSSFCPELAEQYGKNCYLPQTALCEVSPAPRCVCQPGFIGDLCQYKLRTFVNLDNPAEEYLYPGEFYVAVLTVPVEYESEYSMQIQGFPGQPPFASKLSQIKTLRYLYFQLVIPQFFDETTVLSTEHSASLTVTITDTVTEYQIFSKQLDLRSTCLSYGSLEPVIDRVYGCSPTRVFCHRPYFGEQCEYEITSINPVFGPLQYSASVRLVGVNTPPSMGFYLDTINIPTNNIFLLHPANPSPFGEIPSVLSNEDTSDLALLTHQAGLNMRQPVAVYLFSSCEGMDQYSGPIIRPKCYSTNTYRCHIQGLLDPLFDRPYCECESSPASTPYIGPQCQIDMLPSPSTDFLELSFSLPIGYDLPDFVALEHYSGQQHREITPFITDRFNRRLGDLSYSSVSSKFLFADPANVGAFYEFPAVLPSIVANRLKWINYVQHYDNTSQYCLNGSLYQTYNGLQKCTCVTNFFGDRCQFELKQIYANLSFGKSPIPGDSITLYSQPEIPFGYPPVTITVHFDLEREMMQGQLTHQSQSLSFSLPTTIQASPSYRVEMALSDTIPSVSQINVQVDSSICYLQRSSCANQICNHNGDGCSGLCLPGWVNGLNTCDTLFTPLNLGPRPFFDQRYDSRYFSSRQQIDITSSSSTSILLKGTVHFFDQNDLAASLEILFTQSGLVYTTTLPVIPFSISQPQARIEIWDEANPTVIIGEMRGTIVSECDIAKKLSLFTLAKAERPNVCNTATTASCRLLPLVSPGSTMQTECNCLINYYGPGCDLFFAPISLGQYHIDDPSFVMKENLEIGVAYKYEPEWLGSKWDSPDPFTLQLDIIVGSTTSTPVFTDLVVRSVDGNYKFAYFRLGQYAASSVLQIFGQNLLTFPPTSAILSNVCPECNATNTVNPVQCLRNISPNNLIQCFCKSSDFFGPACDGTFSVVKKPNVFGTPRASLSNVFSGLAPLTSYYWGQQIQFNSPDSLWLNQRIETYLYSVQLGTLEPSPNSDIIIIDIQELPYNSEYYPSTSPLLSLVYSGNTLDLSLPITSQCEWINNHIDGNLDYPCVLEHTATCGMYIGEVPCVCKESEVDLVAGTSTIYLGPQCQHKITTKSGPYYVGQHLEIIVSRQEVGIDIISPQFAVQSTLPSSDPIPLEVLDSYNINSLTGQATGTVYTVKIPTVPGNINPPTEDNHDGYQDFLLLVNTGVSQTQLNAPTKIVSGCYWAQLVSHHLICNTFIGSNGIASTNTCVNESNGQIECQCNRGWNGRDCRVHMVLRTEPVQNQSYSPDQLVFIEFLEFPNQYAPLSNPVLSYLTPDGQLLNPTPTYVPSITGIMSNTVTSFSVPASKFKDSLTLKNYNSEVPILIDISYISQLPPQTDKLQMLAPNTACTFGYNYVSNSCTCPQPWTTGNNCDIAVLIALPRDAAPPGPVIKPNSSIQFSFEYIDSILAGATEPRTPFPTVMENDVTTPNFHIEARPIFGVWPVSILGLTVLKPPVNGGSGIYELAFDMPIYPSQQSHIVLVTHDSPPKYFFLSTVVVDNPTCSPQGTAQDSIVCFCKPGWYGSSCEYQFEPNFWVIDLQLPSSAFTIPYVAFPPPGGRLIDYVSLELLPEKDENGMNQPINPLLPTKLLLALDTANKRLIFDGSQPLPSQLFSAPYPRYQIAFGVYNGDKSGFTWLTRNNFHFFTFRNIQNTIPLPTFAKLSRTPSNLASFTEKPPNHHLQNAQYTFHANTQFIISVPAPESPHSDFTLDTPIPSTPLSEIKISYYPPTGDGTYSSTPRVLHRESIHGTPFAQSFVVNLPNNLVASKIFYTVTYFTATTHASNAFSTPLSPTYASHTVVSPLLSVVSTCFDINTTTSTTTNLCQSGGKCMPDGKCSCSTNTSGALCNITVKPCEQCDSTHITGCTSSNQCICNNDWEGLLCNSSTACHNDAICMTGMGTLAPIPGKKCGNKCECNNSSIIGQRCETCILQCNNGKSMQKCSKCGCDAGFTGSNCLCKSDTGTVVIKGIPADLLALHVWTKANPSLDTDLLRPDFVNSLRASVELIRLDLETTLTEFLSLQPGSLKLTMIAIDAQTSTPTAPVYYTQIQAQIIFGCSEWNPLLDRDELRRRWDTITPFLFDFATKNFQLPDENPDIIDVGELNPTEGTYKPDEGESNAGFVLFNFNSYFFILMTIAALLCG